MTAIRPLLLGLLAGWAPLLAGRAAIVDGLVAYYDFEQPGNEGLLNRAPGATGIHATRFGGGSFNTTGNPSGPGFTGNASFNGGDGLSNRDTLLVGRALNLVDARGDAIVVPQGTTQLGKTFTVAAWHTLTPGSSNPSPRYFVFEASDNFDVSWGISSTNTYLSYNAQVGANSIVLPRREWHHVAHVYTTTGTNTVLETYVNGARLGARNAASANLAFTALHFGRARAGTDDRDWDGMLDEVAVWNRALTASDVTALRDLGLAGLPLTTDPAPLPVAGQVFISEFMADNPGRAVVPHAPEDMDGSSPDWIELRNPASTPADLTGWALSDDPALPGKWVFPSQSIRPFRYLVVFASGKNRATAGVQLHTNFKLAAREHLILSQPDGGGGWLNVSQVGGPIEPYPRQRPGLSYGWPSNDPLATPGYFHTHSAGAPNPSFATTNFVGDTTFSVDRGFYDAPFTVIISNSSAGATLVYTLDGSEPSESNGVQVPPADESSLPFVELTISDSTLLRARGIRAGWIPSNVDTQTYVFWDRVRTQTGPLPSTGISGTNAAQTVQWGAAGGSLRTPPGPDWEVDPDVVNHADPASRFEYDDLKSIPSVSLVTNWKGLFGPSTAGAPTGLGDGGIYVGAAANVANEGIDRPFSLEFFNPLGSTNTPNAVRGHQVNGRAHIFGGTSPDRWKVYKLSFNFEAGEDIGYDLYGTGRPARARKLILDARMNQTWLHPDPTQRTRGDYARDQVMTDLQAAMGGPDSRSRAVHLFLNGLYWGLYILHDRPDEDFLADQLGGDSDDWDVFKHTLASNLNEGSPTLVHSTHLHPAAPVSHTNSTALVYFNDLMSRLGVTFTNVNSTRDLRLQSEYEPVWARIDQQPFLDYLLLNFHAGNADWSHKNYYAGLRRTDPEPRWRWLVWDAEHVFRDGSENLMPFNPGNTAAVNGRPGSPHHLHYLLSTNTEYRVAFADTIQRNLFNGGPLTVASTQALFQRRLDEVDRAVRGESARWGDNRNDAAPYTRGDHWLPERARILDTVVPQRHASMLANYRAAGLYPSAAAPAPEFSHPGGAVTNGFTLALDAPGGVGEIHYTLDGADPREPWTAAARGTAYTSPFSLPGPVRVRARFLSSLGEWSALTEASFVPGVPASSNNLAVSEIHYNPFGPDEDLEFIELLNLGTNRLDLTGVEFVNGVIFAFPDGASLPGGARTVVVQNLAAFQAHHGTGVVAVAGVYAGSLDNGGETLTLLGLDGADPDTDKDVIWSARYDDDTGWPAAADGEGYSLTWIPGAWPATAAWNWRAGTALDGTPGEHDAAPLPIDPLADLDANQRPDLLDYALPDGRLDVSVITGAVIRLTYHLAPAPDHAVVDVQCSTNLVTWTSLYPALHRQSPRRLPDGRVEQVWLHAVESGPGTRYRVRVQLR